MAYCVDASVAVPFLIPLEQSKAAKKFWRETLNSREPIIGPSLLFAETTSTLRKFVHRGTVKHEEADIALGHFLRLPINEVGAPSVYLEALDVANRVGHGKAYDAQYIAVARLHGCPLVTCDRGMAAVAGTMKVEAKLLA